MIVPESYRNAVNEAACQVIDIARVGCFDESQVIHAMLLRVH
jgi:hypothetical protein